MSDRFARARQTFPALHDRVFLDAACLSVVSNPVYDAVKNFLDLCRHPDAKDASRQHIEMDRIRNRAVREAARLLNADPDEIALVESTTHGLNIAANSIPLSRGDRILIADTEYLQVAIPWKMKERSVGVEIVPVRSRDNGVLVPEDFERAMDERTRVLCVSSVQWCTGYRIDLAALSRLCRDRGVYLVVDAIQEMGACPIDVKATPVDFLTAGGHKWLNAPFGCGMLYVARKNVEALEPPMYGYLALEEPEGGWGAYFQTPDITPFCEWHFQNTAKKFEIAGTSNYPGAAGLGASLAQINELGIEEIYRHIQRLTRRLHEELRKLGASVVSATEPASARSGITVFNVFPTVDENRALMQALLNERIFVAMRYTAHIGGIRVSTHFFNNDDDIDRLIFAIRKQLSR
ncbi:MAG: aminotransferase class V-fold PLP-dependent enzyme [candidate division KSB1 bacterium]|nr:aminotransferase class V-fold PLP-dependent enzyme [candidate division KSB1 bacterium]